MVSLTGLSTLSTNILITEIDKGRKDHEESAHRRSRTHRRPSSTTRPLDPPAEPPSRQEDPPNEGQTAARRRPSLRPAQTRRCLTPDGFCNRREGSRLPATGERAPAAATRRCRQGCRSNRFALKAAERGGCAACDEQIRLDVAGEPGLSRVGLARKLIAINPSRKRDNCSASPPRAVTRHTGQIAGTRPWRTSVTPFLSIVKRGVLVEPRSCESDHRSHV